MSSKKVLIGLFAFAGGILVGRNWDKIKNFVKSNLMSKENKTPLLNLRITKNIITKKHNTRFCSQCKTKLKSTTKFCYKCGKKQ